MRELTFARRLRRLFWKPTVTEEVAEELAHHLAALERELLGRGLSPEAARAEARRRFGDPARLAPALVRTGTARDRDRWRREWWHDLAQDVRYAWRALRHAPGFAATAVGTLGLGLGATVAIFSTLYAVVLRPLPIPQPDRVVLINTLNDERLLSTSVGNFTAWEERNAAAGVFTALGAISWGTLTLLDQGEPERLLGGRVTAGYFTALGLAPALGRAFLAEEDGAGAPRVVILSDRLWRRRFGADTGVVGRTIVLNNAAHEVVGVMPAAFDFTADQEELWIPAGFTAAQRAEHDEHYLTVYARLSDGTSFEQAEAPLREVMRRISAEYPQSNQGNSARLQPVMQAFVGDAGRRITVLFGAVTLVLLIACANVASLLLARGAGRARELAVRAAIGAGRGRIVRQLLVEGLVMALLAAGLGVGLAYLALAAIVAWAPPGTPRLSDASLNGVVLLFAVALAILSTLLFALLPALRASRPDLQRRLRTATIGTEGGHCDWARQALVAGEVALAIMLLVGAALLVRTSLHLATVDPGFDSRGLVSARLSLPRERYPAAESVRSAFLAILADLQQATGVAAASLVTQVPLGAGGGDNGLIPEGKPLHGSSAIGARFRIVPPGYFATLGVPLRSGRDFDTQDRAGTPRSMIVNETLARALFPGQDPIGKRVACCEGEPDDPRWKTVVGVVADVRTLGPAEDTRAEFFLPIAQTPDVSWDWIGRTLTLVLRSRGEDPQALVPAMREAVRRADPTLALYAIATMDQRLAESLAPARFNSALLGVLAAVGLALALVGIYGVVAFVVSRRASEIGVRMALGATPRGVVRMVVTQGMRPIMVGLLAGTLGALATTRLLAGDLRGVSPTDPATFAAVLAALTVVALLAALLPARRATRVDVLVVLRGD